MFSGDVVPELTVSAYDLTGSIVGTASTSPLLVRVRMLDSSIASVDGEVEKVILSSGTAVFSDVSVLVAPSVPLTTPLVMLVEAFDETHQGLRVAVTVYAKACVASEFADERRPRVSSMRGDFSVCAFPACPLCLPSNGVCLANGQCACDGGWKGVNCDVVDQTLEAWEVGLLVIGVLVAVVLIALFIRHRRSKVANLIVPEMMTLKEKGTYQLPTVRHGGAMPKVVLGSPSSCA